jgi:putative NADH-flavin reductase
MLVFGATGKTGGAVVQAALAAAWRVTVFVRNPDKVPAALLATHAAALTVVQGDLNDCAAVAAAVRAAAPTAVVDASSALPFPARTPPNNADRNGLLRATVEALQADGRVADCVLLLVGGQLVPEPGGDIASWGVAAMAWVLRTLVAPSLFREAQKGLDYLFLESPPALRFTMLRMGFIDEARSRGALRAEATPGNIQRGTASACDIGAALVALAAGEERQWDRKAIYFNYA